MDKQILIDFIIPQFRDPRVIRAIRSITAHRDAERFRIIVQDGGRDSELQHKVTAALRSWDIHAVEADKGIFDALNRGLDKVTAEWIGWIGSDDMLAADFDVSELLSADKDIGFVSYATQFFREGAPVATRIYTPVASRGLRRFGAHVPHFSTFIRKDPLGSARFDESLSPCADIFFFLDLEQRLHGKTTERLSTYMAEGGASNTSAGGILRNNLKVYQRLRQRGSTLHAVIFVVVKLIYKVGQRLKALLSSPRVQLDA